MVVFFVVFVGGTSAVVWIGVTLASVGLTSIFSIATRGMLDREFGRGAGITFGVLMLGVGLVLLIIGIGESLHKK